jgi:hypothetical protein
MKPTTASLFLIQRDYCPLSMLLRRAQRQAVCFSIDDKTEVFVFADGSVLIHEFATETDDDSIYVVLETN